MMNFKIKKKKEVAAAAADVNNECFLEHKRKKTWKDAKSGQKCLMLYPRSLYLSASGDRTYWIWNSFKDTSDENIEVAKLSHICWLDVSGKLNISELSSGTLYEVLYEIKLTKGAFGWEHPIKLKLSLPNGTVQLRQVSLLLLPRGQWIKLNVGNFRTEDKTETSETKEVSFDLYEHDGGYWKSGLIIKGAILRPIT